MNISQLVQNCSFTVVSFTVALNKSKMATDAKIDLHQKPIKAFVNH